MLNTSAVLVPCTFLHQGKPVTFVAGDRRQRDLWMTAVKKCIELARNTGTFEEGDTSDGSASPTSAADHVSVGFVVLYLVGIYQGVSRVLTRPVCGSGHELSNVSRVESDQIRRGSKSHGSGRVASGRVGSDGVNKLSLPQSRVGEP